MSFSIGKVWWKDCDLMSQGSRLTYFPNDFDINILIFNKSMAFSQWRRPQISILLRLRPRWLGRISWTLCRTTKSYGHCWKFPLRDLESKRIGLLPKWSPAPTSDGDIQWEHVSLAALDTIMSVEFDNAHRHTPEVRLQSIHPYHIYIHPCVLTEGMNMILSIKKAAKLTLAVPRFERSRLAT